MARPVSNPPNPWSSTSVEWIGPPPEARLEVYEEHARTVLSENDSPDVPFRWSVNPYRGCYHACAYCYARPGHQYLGFGAGTDFDRKIVVKVNAAECLERQLSRPSWRPEPISFSGVTDCYQPLEASYGLTRACLERCLQHRNPVSIVTKSALVRRDEALIAELARTAGATVFLSIPFAEDRAGRLIEPGASAPAARFETLARLAARGVPTGVAVAPVIPGLNDEQIPTILRRAAEAGATKAFLILLRLPREVRPVFRERLQAAFPERVERVFSALAETRGVHPDAQGFGQRMCGSGPRWQAIERLFEIHCRRNGLAHRGLVELPPEGSLDGGGERPTAPPRARRGERDPRQGELFE